MNELERAKEQYNSIEIPQELENLINEAIKLSEIKKKHTVKVHFLRIAPVAVCAVICFVIGMAAFPGLGKSESAVTSENGDSGMPMLARSVPEADAGAGIEQSNSSAFDGDDGNYKMETVMDAVADLESLEYAASAKKSVFNSFVAAKIDESIEEAVKLENVAGAYGEVAELYSDEEVYSYCVTTYPSNAANYYNIKQSDGSDIPIEDVVDDVSGFDEDCTYYFKSRKCLVVICDGEEKEVIID